MIARRTILVLLLDWVAHGFSRGEHEWNGNSRSPSAKGGKRYPTLVVVFGLMVSPVLGQTVGSAVVHARLVRLNADQPKEVSEGLQASSVAGVSDCNMLEGTGVIGPDVIVGNLPGLNSYGSENGISAFSVATDSCNIGDECLRWIAGTNEHPVIAQNMYRLKDNRFEQIGMSWLKHGFFALTSSLCDTCNPPSGVPSGTRLGVGCSDLYSAFLNGQQSNLGPRSQVDAHTGVFTFPIAGCSGCGLLERRVQVHDVDLDNPGAQYFVEGHYVTPDDAMSGNGNNNASYRPIVFVAPGSCFPALDPNEFCAVPAPGSQTQRQQPAIRAWQDTDPSVVEKDVPVPGEGLFILAAKAIDLGNGVWRYEYALQNLNSDRSGGSFSVPVPVGAFVDNIGFHDVDYHSGEPYDLSDWPAIVADGSVTWSTTSFDVNPDANALRWGTLYNFRFDANVGPDTTTVTIGLFKPGFPAEVMASTIGPVLGLIDCNGNGIADACDIDCGPLGGTCDVAGCGLSDDCNGNGIPDECDIADCPPEDTTCQDCNGNGIPDQCELVCYYGVIGHGSQVYEFDPTTGWPATLVCDLAKEGVDNVNAAEFSSDGFLFVVGGSAPRTLFKIDLRNGCSVSEPWDWGEPTEAIEAIAWDGVCLLYFVSNTQMKTFNVCTGFVDTLDQPIGFNVVQGIDFSPDGTLFGISSYFGGHQHNTILEINTATGAGTAICDLPSAVPDINSLDINAYGDFHALTSSGSPGSPGAAYRIHLDPDPLTGICPVTELGATELDFGALASEPCNDCNNNGIPNECEGPPQPERLALPGEPISTKNRFLSFSAVDVGRSQAVRVTFVDLPPPFDVWNNTMLWVDAPVEVSENAGCVDPACAPAAPTFQAATLQCTGPVFLDWNGLGVVHVLHEGIVPDGLYQIQVIDETCDPNVEANFSAPLELTQAKWGDTLENCAFIPCLPPEGVVTILDVLGDVDKFVNAPTAIIKARAELVNTDAAIGGCVNLKVDIIDVLRAVDALLMLPYPFTPSMPSDPCASTCPNPLP